MNSCKAKGQSEVGSHSTRNETSLIVKTVIGNVWASLLVTLQLGFGGRWNRRWIDHRVNITWVV